MSTLIYNAEKEHLLLELDKKDMLDERVFSSIQSLGFKGCLETKYSEKKKAFRYDLTNLISLKVRLKDTIERDEFYFVLKNWYDALLGLFNSGVEPNKIDWSSDLIFLDAQGRVYFLVYPLHTKTVEGIDIYNVLRGLITHVKPLGASDDEAFKYLQEQLKKVDSNTLSKEQFINALKKVVYTYYEDNLQNYVPNRLNALINGVETMEERKKREEVRVEVAGVSLDMTGLNVGIQERTSILRPEDDEDEFTEDDRTQILVEDGSTRSEATIIRADGSEFVLTPYADESKWVFGKQLAKGNHDVDFELGGNKMISRVHFRVISRDDSFYVEDLGSTNGTFVDSSRVSKGAPLEMFNGSQLKIANEVCRVKISEV